MDEKRKKDKLQDDASAMAKNSSKTDPEERLKELIMEEDSYQLLHNRLISIRDRWLSVILLLPVYVLILIVILPSLLYRLMEFIIFDLQMDVTPLTGYIVIFIVSIIISLVLFVPMQYRVWRASTRLRKLQKNIDETYLLFDQFRIEYLQKRLLFLTGRAGRINWVDQGRRAKSDGLRKDIGNLVSDLERIQKLKRKPKTPPAGDWDDAQFMLVQWDEILNDEEREISGQKRWRSTSIVIAIVYLVLLILTIPVFEADESIFGVPARILIWSGLGSFTAILYRFYKSSGRINFEKEFRWLIARPIIGIIMGGLAYLALASGVLILNSTPGSVTPSGIDIDTLGEQWQYWIIAFLAGFSDKFYEQVIEWLTSRFTAGEEDKEDVNNDTSNTPVNEEVAG